MESHCVYKPHVKVGPIPSRRPTQIELHVIFIHFLLSHISLFGHFFYLIDVLLVYCGFWIRVFTGFVCVSSFPVLFCFYWPVCFLQKERCGAGWVGRWEYLGGGGETYNQNILYENIFNQKKKIYKTFSVKGFTKVTFFSVWLPKK